MRYLLIFALLPMLLSACVGASPEITPEQARLVVEEMAQKIQWTPNMTLLDGLKSEFTARVVKYTTPDNDCFLESIVDKDPDYAAYVAEMKLRLAGRRYYAVIYEQPTDFLRTFICFFIDGADGHLIAVARF